jgi:hypothetical protein
MRIAFTISCLGLLALAGCTSDEYLRTEGMTIGAGNAQAANTVMQMVDPWQLGVQATNLKVPAERSQPAADAASSDGSSATTTGSSNN